MSLFQFKQFTLRQTDSAAKLTTDATIFGAWLPLDNGMTTALEVGTGTGILSLMVAQRSALQIQAIEIDEAAFNEAQYNFVSSPWAHQLQAFHMDFNLFASDKKFDLIFSNPPFFKNSLQSSTNIGKNIAYHTNHLSFEQLTVGINRYLTENGKAYVMLPAYEMELFQNLMEEEGFHILHTLSIYHNKNKSALRVIHGFSKDRNIHLKEEKIYIRDEKNEFHPEYVKLLKPFLTIF